ncbi:crotonobetainyl-CoA:carnitine CoA-transferase CaiB-like acyl-CoA transferase [Paraburkholderia sp. BL6669N2]|uniref:CaiB/BaiF CoA transferase family protein n=1 Tax=Paraburkholderia sp. BL6669N2 TaxID=1938807 RepID=UPI000E2577DE|nr:CoA transferase [Paraburkholderia sp. BL6669N2]REG58497.1 crotonobetainyl-CoA:carnitine CoA-transferase CaiB-like acyl-CoA transferase [Paraburkholderia sp. BL6669N2]
MHTPQQPLQQPTGPLTGVRVIDLTINVLGPVATQLLGDMGADVIKIEPPEGDQNRKNGPGRNPDMAVFYTIMNRNKRSVSLNLKLAECREAVLRLVETADVFIHSMRPSAARRLGIDYESIKARNPRIIYASGPGYRPDGPYKDRPAFDDVIQGETGIAAMNRDADGSPRYFPTVIVDKFCGYVLASSVSMALYHRERTGLGQCVQVPMFETMLQFNLFEHLWEGALGSSDGTGLGYTRMFSPHRRPYATKDGHICLLAVNNEQWRRVLCAIEAAHLLDDPRFCHIADRMRNINELYGIVSEAIKTRTTAEWNAIFAAADVPHGPVRELNELMQDHYIKETGFFQHYEHPTEGEMVMTSIPVHFSESPGNVRYLPPNLGEHSIEVLIEAGYTEHEATQLSGHASSQTMRPPETVTKA